MGGRSLDDDDEDEDDSDDEEDRELRLQRLQPKNCAFYNPKTSKKIFFFFNIKESIIFWYNMDKRTKLSRAENSKAKFRTILGKYKFLATHSDIFFFLELIFDLVG